MPSLHAKTNCFDGEKRRVEISLLLQAIPPPKYIKYMYKYKYYLRGLHVLIKTTALTFFSPSKDVGSFAVGTQSLMS